jgi:tripartite-type tricarboxylate transporter receptor subunit TctC
MITAASMLLLAPTAQAQVFPSKAVRLVISFPPGAGPDVLARAISPKLAEKWGQQVLVDNRPGAGGNIATELVAKAAPDGHTVVVLSNHFTINPPLFRKVPYDPVKDFAPVILATWTPSVLVVHPSLPVNNVKQFLDFAKSRPGQLDYSSGGNGSVSHMAGALLQAATGIKVVHVPYKGPAEASIALVGGHVSFAFITAPSALVHSKSGRLKALAVTSAKRSAAAPDWPTIAESGVPGYEIIAWQGILAPAGTPTAVVNALNADIGTVLATAETRATLLRQGLEILGGTPADFADFISKELVKWEDVVRKTGARVD